ncbi:MAG: hypothetical protein RL154_912 [Pseudomonadota bacterium]|jgi:hypothetical protein
MKKVVQKLAVIGILALSSQMFAAEPINTVAGPLKPDNSITLTVIGQGLAPESAQSKYHAIALAKRAAITDAYRLLAEKLYGVKIDGQDTIRNMVLQKSDVKACVSAMIQYANVVETKCADNFCEVQVELKVAGTDWYPKLASAN